MAESRKSYTIRFQTRDPDQKAIIQWLESHEKSDRNDLVLRAIKLLYGCYVGKFKGISEQTLWERFQLHTAQVDDHFRKVAINLFGEEIADILHQYFSEKREPNFGQNSPPKPPVNPEASVNSENNQDDDNEDDLYGGEIDEDLDEEVEF